MKRNGFTLIEMLVALSLFAIAALALARLDAFSLSTTNALKGNSLTRLVAENEAALVMSDANFQAEGEQRFDRVNGGQNFTVIRAISPTPNPRLVRVDISVTPMDGGSINRLTLVRRVGR